MKKFFNICAFAFLFFLPAFNAWAEETPTTITGIVDEGWYYIEYVDGSTIYYLSYETNSSRSDYRKVKLVTTADHSCLWRLDHDACDLSDDKECTSDTTLNSEHEWMIFNYKHQQDLGIQQASANYVVKAGERTEPYTIAYREGKYSLLSSPIYWNAGTEKGKHTIWM